jgi:peptidoglycan-associated lipoprotein
MKRSRLLTQQKSKGIFYMQKNFFVSLAGLLLASGIAACSSSKEPSPAAMPSSVQSKSATKPAPDLRKAQSQTSLEALRRGDSAKTPADSALKEIFFEFDRYDLSGDARATLNAAADWLRNNPAVRVEVEGHCDERGTNEYNLALGAKRAQTAKDYLVTLGVAAGRLSTMSYGEEIPVCRQHNDDCWQKNRRDRFVALSAKPEV